MPRLLLTHASEAVRVMSKLVPTKYCERQATENFDQALSGMLGALRKPFKLTATLKQRALKNKPAEKNRRSEALSRDADGEVESRTARVTPDLCRV